MSLTASGVLTSFDVRDPLRFRAAETAMQISLALFDLQMAWYVSVAHFYHLRHF